MRAGRTHGVRRGASWSRDGRVPVVPKSMTLLGTRKIVRSPSPLGLPDRDRYLTPCPQQRGLRGVLSCHGPDLRSDSRGVSDVSVRQPGCGELLPPLRDVVADRRFEEVVAVRRPVLRGRDPVRADLHVMPHTTAALGRQLPLGDDPRRRADPGRHRARSAADRRRRGRLPGPARLPRLHLRREPVGGRAGRGRRRPLRGHRRARGAGVAVLLRLGLRRAVGELARGRRARVGIGTLSFPALLLFAVLLPIVAEVAKNLGRGAARRAAAVRRHDRRPHLRRRRRHGLRRLRDHRRLLLGLHRPATSGPPRARLVGRRGPQR